MNRPLTVIPQITAASRMLVVGLGRSGLAAVKFLSSLGARVSVSEAAALDAIDPAARAWLAEHQIPLETNGHTPELFTTVDCIVVSPGVSLNLGPLAAARGRGIPVLGEMAVASRYLKTPMVAVTGTNGKTTVTSLLGEIFKCDNREVFVGGNIGTPVFEYLLGPQQADIAVLEISSFQLDTAGGAAGFRPDAGLLLNITPDHLDRYDSFADYAASKFLIFAAQLPGDTAILNADDPEIMGRTEQWPSHGRCFFFGRTPHGRPGAVLEGKTVKLTPETTPDGRPESYDLAATSLNESPNLENGMAAILTARLMGCQPAAIARGLAEFSTLPHRMTTVAEINGVRWIDDSKGTNIGALQSALTSLPGRVLLIAGGRDKGGAYEPLAELIAAKVKTLLLIGEAAEKMAQTWRAAARIERPATLPAAVRLAAELAAPGDTVLLSPACSSFDMFTSYVERGRVFREAVEGLSSDRSDRSDRSVG